jgi:CelD/BcsL family acetyltransferase involved in cellulose biosynthesis
VKVSLISGRELGGDLARTWLQLQDENSDLASPFFHSEFTKAIASVRDDVEIAVIESDGKIAGFFPFHRNGRRVGYPVGEIISDYQGVICAKDFRFSPTELLRHCRLIGWEFDHVPTSQSSFAPFQLSTEPSPQMDVSCGYEAYVEERRRASSELFKKMRNLSRRVERDIGPLRYVAHSTDRASFATVLSWKSDQYRRSKKHDLLAPGWKREAMDYIFTTQAEGLRGILSLLYAGDRLIAGHFGMRSQQVWHYWFPSYDTDAAGYSPGLMLLLKMAEQAPGTGAKVIDLGKGVSPYKLRLMNSSSMLASGSVELPSWRSFRRRTWKVFRSRIAASPAGPRIRATLQWLRSNRDSAS